MNDHNRINGPMSEVNASLQAELESMEQFDGYLNRNYVKCPTNSLSEKAEVIRIMQWNILAQGFCPVSQFVLCPDSVLAYERRRRYILLELTRYAADVICLEEADLYNEFLEFFDGAYKGAFYPKPRSACLLYEGNRGPDGCGIYYRADKFDCVETISFDLVSQEQLEPKLGCQVALLCQLRSKRNSDVAFYVLCTHLKAKKGYEERRKYQGEVILAELQQRIGSNLPFFVCGDFNATPQEPVISAFMSSDLHLQSAYTIPNELANSEEQLCETEFTTWKMRGTDNKVESEVCHIIDYIWYSRTGIQCIGLFKTPSKEEIGPNGLPCPRYPSDHLSLIADFAVSSTLGVNNSSSQQPC